MSLDFTPQTISSGYISVDALDENFTNIQTALADGLSRSGTTPNTMSADLDMNSNDILNAGAINTSSLSINGTQVTTSELAATELPDQSGNADKYLTTNGTSTSWAALDSADVVFDPGSDGDHVNSTVEAKLQEWVSVYDFGAVGDNSTDDTTAIQNAVDYCDTNGYTLYFPPATYAITGTITVLSCNILGTGATLKCSTAVTIGVQVGDASNIYEGEIKGLRVSGQSKGTQPANSYAYKLVNASQAKFDFIEADRFPRGIGVVPAAGTRVAYSSFIHPYAHRCDYNMYIYVDGSTAYAAENIVIGGRFQMSGSDEATNHIYAERTSGAGSMNHWKWYGPSVESYTGASATADIAIRLKRAQYWLIEQPRTEGDWNTADIQFDANCSDNRLVTNYQDGSFSISDLGTSNIIQYHERVMCNSGLPMYVQRGQSSITEVTPASTDVAIFHRAGVARVKIVAGTGSASAITLGDESDQNQGEILLGTGPGLIFQADGTNVAELTSTRFKPHADSTYALGGSSYKWSTVYADNVSVGTANISSGTGTPEGAVTGTVGDVFLRTDGGAGSTMYVKESGSGNTGWAAV